MVEIILGRVAEAIYFTLFFIFTKRLNKNRIVFMLLMIFEYLLLYECFPYYVRFQLSYTIMVFVILKILYNKQAQITDIFTFGIASIFLMITSIIFSLPKIFFNLNFTICVLLNRIFIFSSLFVFRNKLNNIQKLYKKLWNRNNKVKNKIKSTTFRSINLVLFNIMFYVINLCMIYAIHFNSLR
jgi:hypothetical protein